jgi:hypothetical protein
MRKMRTSRRPAERMVIIGGLEPLRNSSAEGMACEFSEKYK